MCLYQTVIKVFKLKRSSSSGFSCIGSATGKAVNICKWTFYSTVFPEIVLEKFQLLEAAVLKM